MASNSDDLPTYRIEAYEPSGNGDTWRLTVYAPHTKREIGIVYHRCLGIALRMLYVALQDEGVDEIDVE